MNALEGAAVSGAAANGAASAQAAQPASDQATQITSLQGMGKEIAPRVVQLVKNATEKRDIAGFNAALNYATRALRSSPEVQLGTREGGSGVGITQKPGTGVAAAPATATSNAAAAGDIIPRDKMPAPKTRSEDAFPVEKKEKREPSPVIDGVNLNMTEGQVAELIFVETRAITDDE